MRRWPFLLLLLIPLADAVVLVVVAATVLGALETVLLVVLTALVGVLLVRAEGRRTVAKFLAKLQRGEIPADEALDGGLLIAAGAFLLTPGLVTDALGFLLALPPTRYPIRVALKKYVVVPYVDRRTDGFGSGKVYTFGFPDGDGEDGAGGVWGPGGGPGPGGPGSGPGPGDGDDDVIDVDAYEVDVEDAGGE